MTTRTRRVLLSIVAGVSAAMLVAFAIRPDLARDPKPPSAIEGMAAWIAVHPADWHTASALTDAALDSNLPRRFELWRASYALAQNLAPRRQNASAGFVRAGLFHWYELSAGDRKAVLDAAAPLLRDPRVFVSLFQPLWTLTRDLAYLRRNAPQTLNALDALRTLAVVNGQFDDYRQLREAVRRRRFTEFLAARDTKPPAEWIEFLPARLEVADATLVRAMLEELDRRAVDVEALRPRADALAEFVIHHDIAPLGGLEPLLVSNILGAPTRARLALRMNKPDVASRIELTSGITGAPEWIPYRLERALYDAHHGNLAAAQMHLSEAAVNSPPRLDIIAAAAEVAQLAGDTKDAARLRQQLAAAPREWRETCSRDEICGAAYAWQWSNPVRVSLSVSQSDEIPPYVEIYVDDALGAEGEVRDEATFVVDNAGAGLHRVEIRVVNRTTRNGVQRRLRLS